MAATVCADVQSLIDLFDRLFRDSYNTVLIKGDDEPIYLPADGSHPHHRIIFAHGYFSSALHEIAHWCVAGAKRRQLEDFGYWYKPDGRSEEEQRLFESVEVKPQALEWIFSLSATHSFRFSADNLSGDVGDMEPFKEKVLEQVRRYLEGGLPKRSRLFSNALRDAFGVAPLRFDQFQL